MQCISPHGTASGVPMRIVSGVRRGMLRVAKQPTLATSQPAPGLVRALPALPQCQLHLSALWNQPRRYQPFNLATLESRASRPKRIRQPTWTTDQVLGVQAIRERYPAWGKAKLQLLLAGEGTRLSVSMVGRILSYLRRRGQLPCPPRPVGARKRPRARPYAVRKPRGPLFQHSDDATQARHRGASTR